jgi:hypothetical protein
MRVNACAGFVSDGQQRIAVVEPNKYHVVSCVHDECISMDMLVHASSSSKKTDLYCKAAFAVAMILFWSLSYCCSQVRVKELAR